MNKIISIPLIWKMSVKWPWSCLRSGHGPVCEVTKVLSVKWPQSCLWSDRGSVCEVTDVLSVKWPRSCLKWSKLCLHRDIVTKIDLYVLYKEMLGQYIIDTSLIRLLQRLYETDLCYLGSPLMETNLRVMKALLLQYQTPKREGMNKEVGQIDLKDI